MKRNISLTDLSGEKKTQQWKKTNLLSTSDYLWGKHISSLLKYDTSITDFRWVLSTNIFVFGNLFTGGDVNAKNESLLDGMSCVRTGKNCYKCCCKFWGHWMLLYCFHFPFVRGSQTLAVILSQRLPTYAWTHKRILQKQISFVGCLLFGVIYTGNTWTFTFSCSTEHSVNYISNTWKAHQQTTYTHGHICK